MKQQEILKKIGVILKELNEQYEYLQSPDADFNDLELELFAANAHFLTEHTEILRKITQHLAGSTHAHTAVVAARPEPAPQAVVPHHTELPPDEDIAESFAAPLPPLAESAVVFDPTPVSIPESARAEEPLVIEEPQLIEEPPVAEEPEPAVTEYTQPEPEIPVQPAYTEPVAAVEETPAPEVSIAPTRQDAYSFTRQEPQVSEAQHDFSISTHREEEAAPAPVTATYTAPGQPVPVKVAEPPVTQPAFTAPKAEEPVLTLNQRLSAQLHGGNAAAANNNSSGQQISDLKSAISLNDKLLFVKDLFNGYSLAYSEVLELLNRSKSFEDADRFLQANYVAKYNWADKPATVEKFYSFLHRRFPQ